MGKYILEEIKTIDGLAINKEPIEIVLEKQNDTTKIYNKEITVENKTTLIQIYKIDKDSKEQLKGAKFVLCDEDGNEVARWISDEKPYAIEGLSTEKTYFLEEVEAPDGYVLNKEIVELRVEDDTAKEIRIENEKIKPVEEPEKPVEETPKTVKTIQKKLPKTGY